MDNTGFKEIDTKNKERKNKIIDMLKGAIETEYHLAKCCGHIASLIKNGRIKSQCYLYADLAAKSEEELRGYLYNLNEEEFVFEDKCKFCRLNPGNFSLKGAIDLGLETSGIAIKFYKELLNLIENRSNKDFFRKLLKNKISQRDALKKEKRFDRSQKDKSAVIDDFCMPYIVSKLWR